MPDENKIVAMRFDTQRGEWVDVNKFSGAFGALRVTGKCVDCGAGEGDRLTLGSGLSAEELQTRLASSCPCYQALELYTAQINDAVMKQIARFTNLTKLSLSMCSVNVSEAGIKHIADLYNLRELGFTNTKVDDEWLKVVGGLINLRWLDLGGTGISDAGLKHISGLTDLTFLSVGMNEISDDGLKYIADLINLTEIGVWRTNVSEQGLRYLAVNFPNLKRLDSTGTGVGEAMLREVRTRIAAEAMANQRNPSAS